MNPSDHDADFEQRYLAASERALEYSASLAGPSLAGQLGVLTALELDELLEGLTKSELATLLYDWHFWARPKQDPDLTAVPHRILFLLGGRGAGKTIAGANRVRLRVEAGARSIALVGPTIGEVERYMIAGEGGGSDGLLTVFPPAVQPEYKPHKSLVFFHRPECTGVGCKSASTCGGAIAYVNTAEEPEFRGPNLDTVWCDEPAKYRYLSRIWNNIDLATRLPGPIPIEIIITGTPLPLKFFRELIADVEDTVTILMPQSDNAENLDAGYVARMLRKFGGTRLGRQELDAEILSDNPDALFQASILEATRVDVAPTLVQLAVSVDPAIATNPENDETGILAGGIDARGHIYVLADSSSRATPEKWGKDVVQTCRQVGADTVVCERNRGGDLVAANVRAAMARARGELAALALKIVEVLATRGKAIRAEPVSALAEQGRIHIVGHMPELVAELTEWNPRIGGISPNRLDALVWLVWHLAKLGEEEQPDYRAGFRGLTATAAALQGPSSTGLGGLVGALPRSAWGSKL